MNFSEALEELKKGNAVRRKCWASAGIYIFLIGTDVTEVGKGGWTFTNGINDNCKTCSFIAVKNMLNQVTPWIISHVEILADDWMVWTKL